MNDGLLNVEQWWAGMTPSNNVQNYGPVTDPLQYLTPPPFQMQMPPSPTPYDNDIGRLASELEIAHLAPAPQFQTMPVGPARSFDDYIQNSPFYMGYSGIGGYPY